ncbi:MAG: hypothetical protein ACREO1_07010 [Arenimonas sp.]
MTNNAVDTTWPSEAEGFSFLNGHWRVHHRKLKALKTDCVEWIEFKGTAAFFTLLDGLVSVEELRDANGAPFGGAMRTFDRLRRVWLDAWVSASNGVLLTPVGGRFVDDVGEFIAQEIHEGKAMLVRGIWRRISSHQVTWEQAASLDEGKNWKTNWYMRFERINEKTMSSEALETQ